MGEIAINPIHNVHKKYRTMNLVNPYIFAPPVDLSTNTEIGGVASTISTPALLATKLGIDVSRITNFSIVGSDIKCKITGNYTLALGLAPYMPIEWTYFKDLDNLVTSDGSYIRNYPNLHTYEVFGVTTLINGSFNYFGRECPLLANAIFPNALNVSTAAFYGFTDGRKPAGTLRHYIPRATALGTSIGDNQVWNGSGANSNLIIYAHPSLATNNAGTPDGDIAYAISQSATVRYVTNFTAPNPVTTLSAGTIYNTAIQLNFTPPSSTNTVDYYEVYKDGILQSQEVTASGQYITGLTPNTFYNITLKAVDIFYNKSVVSNILSVSTTNTVLDTDASAYMVASVNGQWQPEINNLFTSLKSNSIYAKLQAFYPFLGTTAAQHKWNAKNPLDTDGANRLVFTGSPTFSNNGYLVGGGHANTFLIPNSIQNVNSNGLTVVIGTNNLANANDTAIGAFGSGSNASWIVVKWNNTTYLRESRINFAAVQQTGINEAKGVWTGTRQSSTVSKLFRNSTLIGSVTATGTLPTYPIWIGDLNNNGSPYGSTSQRIQFTAIHEGLSDAEVATLHTIIDIFETALGRKTW